MDYYVRFDNGDIDGPFSLERIRSMVSAGRLTAQSGVVEAKGQGLPTLRELLEWPTISQLLDGAGSPAPAMRPALDDQAASPIVNRYRDAYRVGTALVALGNTIKIVGAILASIILLGSLGAADGSLGGAFAAIGLIVAAVVGGLSWVCGVLVAAQGQILRATLDSAVAGSPFLSDRDRLDAMGLPRAIASPKNRDAA